MAKKKDDILNPSGPRIVRVTCEGAGCIDWHTIKPLQGNYKTRTDEDIRKIMVSIVKFGWAFPSFVSKIDKDIWAIDTHGRLLAAERLEKTGWTIPPVPVDWIHAKTKEEAKQLLLRCDSRYGTINREGYMEFVQDIDVIMEDLSIGVIVEEKEPGEEKYKEKIELILECASENQAAELYDEFKERGVKCRISTL
jgi:hypothetical protein